MTSHQKRKESHFSGKLKGGSVPSKKRINRSIITLRGDGSEEPYVIKNLNRDTLRQKGIVVRGSSAWIDAYKTPNGGLGVPFIDKLGRFTGHLVYKWSCDPRALIATVSATIIKRLLEHCRRHNKNFVVKKHRQSLIRAATYYAFSKNSYFWDRILFFSRNLEKSGRLIHRLSLFFSSKWDDNKRFVYSHANFQAKWLLLRARRPRDKSQFFSSGKGRPIVPMVLPDLRNISNTIRDLAYAMSMI